MVWVIRWLVPLTALVVGHGAVVGEREAGSLRVLLGLPITRREVLLGKLLGRSVVFSAMLSIGLTCAGGALWHLYVGFDLRAYAVFVGLTLLLGLIFVAMGVGFSAAFRSRVRAAGASMGTFALLFFVWHLFMFGASTIQRGHLPVAGEASPTVVFYANANPTIGYESLVEEWVTPLGLESGRRVGTSTYGNWFVGGVEPFYLSPAVLLVVFVLWGILPVLLGARRFTGDDLG